LQRAQRNGDERSGRKFHGDRDHQRQRHGCPERSTNNSFEAGRLHGRGNVAAVAGSLVLPAKARLARNCCERNRLEESHCACIPRANAKWLRWRQQFEFNAATATTTAGHNTKRDIHPDSHAVRNARGFREKFPDFTDFINIGCEIAPTIRQRAQHHLP
jgi:hypothetical protein